MDATVCVYIFSVTITGVTILLSLTVFLNLVAESMPTTSDAVPLIGTQINYALSIKKKKPNQLFIIYKTKNCVQ